MTFQERIDYCSRLRTALKRAGCNGEYDDVDGTDANLRWFPRADSTPEQITLAAQIIAAFPAQDAIDQAAESADISQWNADRTNFAAQYDASIARLQQIENAASPTNPQVIAAVRDIAKYVRQLAQITRRILK